MEFPLAAMTEVRMTQTKQSAQEFRSQAAHEANERGSQNRAPDSGAALAQSSSGQSPSAAALRKWSGNRLCGMPQWLQKRLFGTVNPADEKKLRERMVAAYQHLLVSALYPAVPYFLFVGVSYYFLDGLEGFLYLGSFAFIIALVIVAVIYDLSRRKVSKLGLEIRGIALYTLIAASIVAHHTYHLEPVKLIFFLLLMLVTATASVTIRTAIGSIVVSTAATMWFAYESGHETVIQYGFVSFAGMIVALCMAMLTRIAIRRMTNALVVADRLRENAEHLANHDMLTELPNRRSFFRELRKHLGTAGEDGSGFVLGIVDLDGFKAINDSYGHIVGDRVLIEVASRLKKSNGGECFVARFGGDEFALLLEGTKSDDELRALGSRICQCIGESFLISEIEFSVSASVGFVLADDATHEETELIERADFAMFRAKASKENIVIFSARDEEDLRQIGRIEQALRISDKEEEMSVVFQPQVDIHSGRTTGFEALARWNSPTLGRVRPDVFIAAAERTGLIEEMTPILLNKALKFARGWPDNLKLSFNLSIRDIMSPSAIDKLCAIIETSGVDPKRLEFEVTETLIMSDFETARKSLARLQQLGSRVALDDFGVGYANFGHIDQLSINTIKIDRSFVTRLANGGQTVKLIKTMVDMCSTLGVGSIVEGVETEHELAVLRGIGARNVQGYYYSKPMAAEDIPAFLSQSLLASIGGPQLPAKQAV